MRCGCWEWKGCTDANGRPSFWFPPLGARVSLGVAACWWRMGRRAEKGEAWHAPASCALRDCANPWHRVCGTRSSQMLAQGLERTLQTRLRMSATRRVISDAVVREIVSSRGPLDEIAAKHGISVGYACQLRKGTAKRKFAIAPDIKVVQAKPRRERLVAERIFSDLRIGQYLEDAPA